MAKNEADREDLIRDATALVERVELLVSERDAPTVAGFRRNGFLSIYFGADPVYHFDDNGALRRAFVGGQLYRSEGDTLSRLTRQRTGEETVLLRSALSPAELTRFRSELQIDLKRLNSSFESGAVRISREVSCSGETVSRLRTALQEICETENWLSPAVVKRRFKKSEA